MTVPYAPTSGVVDEAIAPGGEPRHHYRTLLDALGRTDLGLLAAQVAADAGRDEVVHGSGDAAHILHFDPVPRIVDAAEWATLERGLEQRVRALDALLEDAAGPRRVVAEGVIEADVLDTSRYLERELAGAPAPAIRIGVAGPDVIRHPGGELVVLEDNVRTPTLMAYAAYARAALAARLPATGVPAPRDFAGPMTTALAETLRAAAPGVDEPLVVLLDDGPGDYLNWEARTLASTLGIPAVALDGLAHRGDRLVLRADGRAVDVVYRRTAEERLHDDAGGRTALGEAFVGPLRAGTVAVVNAFGAGLADDKRTFAYADDMIRFFCGEEPVLRSVPTLDLGRPEACRQALDRLDELVFKRRSGSGGHGLVVGPRASDAERETLRREILESPADWVAQETIAFSTHPTVIDGRLEPRHVDLRAFVIGGRLMPGGLSRVALAEGDLVVNCSQGGGGKDTWVLAA